MADATHRTARLRFLAVAVTASVALHGLLVVLLCGLPWQGSAAARGDVPVDVVLLRTGSDDGASPAPRRTFQAAVVWEPRQFHFTDEPLEAPRVDLHAPIAAPGGSARTGPDPSSGPSAAVTGQGHGSSAAEGSGPAGSGGWFAGSAAARSVVFVLDRSVSMGVKGGLKRARAEVAAALRRLPPTARFQILAYNQFVEQPPAGRRGELLPATPDVVDRAVAWLDGLPASGGTDHVQALRCGLALRPELLILVSDADDLGSADVDAVTRLNGGRAVVQVVQVGGGGDGAETAMQRLARLNRGVCTRVKPN